MRVKKLHGLGNHLILDGYSEGDLSNEDFIRNLILQLVDVAEMKVISNPLVLYHEADEKQESGVTGTIILSESNITIHTYPHKKWFALDIFSCKEFDVDKIVNFLEDKLKIKDYKKTILKRGV